MSNSFIEGYKWLRQALQMCHRDDGGPAAVVRLAFEVVAPLNEVHALLGAPLILEVPVGQGTKLDLNGPRTSM